MRRLIALAVLVTACTDPAGLSLTKPDQSYRVELVDGTWLVQLPGGGSCGFPYHEPNMDTPEEALRLCRQLVPMIP